MGACDVEWRSLMQISQYFNIQVAKPTFCESIAALQPTEVAAGEQTIFIISDGKVYAAGTPNLYDYLLFK